MQDVGVAQGLYPAASSTHDDLICSNPEQELVLGNIVPQYGRTEVHSVGEIARKRTKCARTRPVDRGRWFRGRCCSVTLLGARPCWSGARSGGTCSGARRSVRLPVATKGSKTEEEGYGDCGPAHER